MRPVFSGDPGIPPERIQQNIDESTQRREILSDEKQLHDGRLAVVGGGPSVLQHLEEIKSFREVWAINETWRFLSSQGIASAMFSVDADDCIEPMAVGATKAVLASRCSPKVFEALAGKPVTVFHLFQDGPKGVLGGSSSATCAFHAAVKLGFKDITLFGCESSFPQGQTHAYRNEERKFLLLVKCNGGEYLTTPDFYVQAQELAKVIKMFPAHFKQVGGGLLGAMVENDDHDVIKMSRAMWEKFGVTCTN